MVDVVLIVVFVYLLVGAVFVIPFLLIGLTKVDGSAHRGTVGFKIIIVPGVIVFWPVLLSKWIQRDNHGDTKAQRSTENTP